MAQSLTIMTVGSALRDTMFYTDDVSIIQNPKKDPRSRELLCVEFGAKIRSNTLHQGFGGGAFNTAVNFSGLGLRTGIITTVGDDYDGNIIRNEFSLKRIDHSFVQVHKKQHTGFAFLLISQATGEHTAFVYYGAAAHIQLTTTAINRMKTDWMYVSSLNGANWKSLLNHLSQHPSRFAWNPGGAQLQAGYTMLKRIIARTAILILNRDEATELFLSHPTAPKKSPTIKQLLYAIQSWGPSIVLITEGKDGAHVYDGKHYFFQPTIENTPKDTTGAGDCFGSSFVTGIIRYKGDIKKSLRLASKNATSLVRSVGAQAGLLTWKQLPQSLQK